MPWQYTPIESGWTTSSVPALADFQNLEKDIQKFGGDVAAAGNSLTNAGTVYVSNITPSSGVVVTLLQLNEFISQYFANDSSYATVACYKGRGTAGSPATVQNGDGLGSFQFYAYGTSITQEAYIEAIVNGTVSGNNVPTDMLFVTNPGTGPAEMFRLMSAGQLRVSAFAAPSNPAAGTFYLYMDSADNKLKARGPSGTVTTLSLP